MRESRLRSNDVEGEIGDCTIFWHRPVDEMHSIENTGDTVSKIPLTSPAGGVKPQSFFDSFWFFKSRSELHLKRKRWEYRQAEASSE
jgi:hypothetical protein